MASSVTIWNHSDTSISTSPDAGSAMVTHFSTMSTTVFPMNGSSICGVAMHVSTNHSPIASPP